jgi:hypothetical protein
MVSGKLEATKIYQLTLITSRSRASYIALNSEIVGEWVLRYSMAKRFLMDHEMR